MASDSLSFIEALGSDGSAADRDVPSLSLLQCKIQSEWRTP
jgi:hypothetical protein